MALWSCIKMKIFIMVIRHPSTGWLYLCVWAAQSSSVRWLHTWISHIPGLSIFHQTYSSIMDAAHQPRPSPDRGRLIALVQPFLRRDDVHAPQPPVVAMGSIGVLLHLKRVVFDVVYGRQDDAGVILLHPGQDRLSPCIRQDTQVELIQMLLCRKRWGKKELKKSNWRIWRKRLSLLWILIPQTDARSVVEDCCSRTWVCLSNQHSCNIHSDCQDPLPSTVYNVKALENEFSAEQQILSQPILYLLLMKMKCQTVTLIPVKNLIRGKTR